MAAEINSSSRLLQRARGSKFSVETPSLRKILGDLSDGIPDGRISPASYIESVKNYLQSKNIQLFRDPKEFISAARRSGLSPERLTRLEERTKDIGLSVSTKDFSGIYVASRSELAKRTDKPGLLGASILGHEAIESTLPGDKGWSAATSGHKHWSIYGAEMEQSAILGEDFVKHTLKSRHDEISTNIQKVRGRKDLSEASDYLKALPQTYEKILLGKGYQSSQVSKLLGPLRESLSGVSNSSSLGNANKKPLNRRRKLSSRDLVKSNPATSSLQTFYKKFNAYDITSGYKQGTSFWSQLQREEAISKGSVRWALDQDSQDKWKGFYLNYGGKEHIVDFSDGGKAHKQLEDLELMVAQDKGYGNIVRDIEEKRRGRASNYSAAKKAATKTVQTASEKKALKVTEYQLPAGLDEYVSKSARPPLTKLNKFALAKVAPYAAAVVIGADVLSSRDKTGPTYGLAGGAAGAALAHKFLRGGGGAVLGGIAGYLAGRVFGSALSAAHTPQIEGFSESGEGSIGRKQLSDFGSGWVGKTAASITRAAGKQKDKMVTAAHTLAARVKRRPLLSEGSDVKSTLRISGLPVGTPKTISPFGLRQTIPQKLPGMGQGEHLDRLVERYSNEFLAEDSPIKLSGVYQEFQQNQLRDRGMWEQYLPTIERAPLQVAGKEVTKKMNQSMAFGRSDVNEAILAYAKEKGMKPPVLRAGTTAPGSLASMSSGRKLSDDLTQAASGASTVNDIGSIRVAKAQIVQAKTRNPSLSLGLADTVNANPQRAVRQKIPAAITKPSGAATAVENNHVRAAKKKTFITAASLSEGSLGADWSFAKVDSQISDLALSRPHGARYRAHHPRVLEQWKQDGSVSEARKKGWTDFGTGWDGARMLGRTLGLAASNKAATGKSFDEILKKLTPNLEKGKVVGTVGAGGVGSVDLMETTIGVGKNAKTFKYARKNYFNPQTAKQSADAEAAGLRAMQDTIAPTPYGRGKAVINGKEQEYMFMELIEDALPASKASHAAGGVTKKQQTQLKDAIMDLHEKGLAHGDIKFGNMLIDKHDNLVLIDPMPARYGDSNGFAGALARAQDAHALQIVSRGGKFSRMHRDLNISSNALAYFQMGPEAPAERFAASLPHVKDIISKAGLPEAVLDIAMRPGASKDLTDVVGDVVGNKKFRPVDQQVAVDAYARVRAEKAQVASHQVLVAHKGFNSTPEGATVRTSMEQKTAIREAQRKSSQAREMLHKESVKTMNVNNANPARRHNYSNQTQSPFDQTRSPFRI